MVHFISDGSCALSLVDLAVVSFPIPAATRPRPRLERTGLPSIKHNTLATMSGPERKTPFVRGIQPSSPHKPAPCPGFTYGAEYITWPNNSDSYHDIFRNDGVAFLNETALEKLLFTRCPSSIRST